MSASIFHVPCCAHQEYSKHQSKAFPRSHIFHALLIYVYYFINILAPVLVPHKLLDLGVVMRPFWRTWYLGGSSWRSRFIVFLLS